MTDNTQSNPSYLTPSSVMDLVASTIDFAENSVFTYAGHKYGELYKNFNPTTDIKNLEEYGKKLLDNAKRITQHTQSLLNQAKHPKTQELAKEFVKLNKQLINAEIADGTKPYAKAAENARSAFNALATSRIAASASTAVTAVDNANAIEKGLNTNDWHDLGKVSSQILGGVGGAKVGALLAGVGIAIAVGVAEITIAPIAALTITAIGAGIGAGFGTHYAGEHGISSQMTSLG